MLCSPVDIVQYAVEVKPHLRTLSKSKKNIEITRAALFRVSVKPQNLYNVNVWMYQQGYLVYNLYRRIISGHHSICQPVHKMFNFAFLLHSYDRQEHRRELGTH